ncbi:hypothetical protein [Ktedonospora formicarum]|uniref:Uncharacterized protein n=1 Tax=Ktedonospora formicarum TaxID=2778364 RepID=A0A8J3HUB9_9CHLR|nr:hypothetical protein [Ktedonospora formicarum]GHO43431.1 hypothetical protein KSX_15940 [Ktedonospora formicarum]
MRLILGINPIIEMGGRISAIIICLFILVLVVVSLALNIAMAFGLDWLREKSKLVQSVRPVVDNANQTIQQAKQGQPIAEDENGVVRALAKVPAGVQTVDEKTVRIADKAAKGIIEVRARTVQAQTVLKALFLPGLMQREKVAKESPLIDDKGREFKSPGYRALLEAQAPEIPVAAEDGQRERLLAQQVRNVTSR